MMKTNSTARYHALPHWRILLQLACTWGVVALTCPDADAHPEMRPLPAPPQDHSTTRPSEPDAFNRIPFRRNDSAPQPHSSPSAGRPQLKAYPTAFATTERPTSISTPISTPLQDEQQESRNSKRPRPSEIVLANSAVLFIDDIHLPALESGFIKSLNVKEGDFVPAGQTIATIDDEMFQLALIRTQEQLAIAHIDANDDISIQAAEKKHKVRAIEAAVAVRLGRVNSKPKSEVRMAVFQEEIAVLEIARARQGKEKAIGEEKLAIAQMKEVEAKLRRHVLKAGFDAYVIEVFKKQQEYVNPGDDVVRMARMDRLWVQAIVDVKDLNPHEALNRPVTVKVELARGETAFFQGKITHVSLERRSSNAFAIKAEIENRPVGDHWILQPESKVEVTIHLDDQNNDAPNGSFGNAATSDKR